MLSKYFCNCIAKLFTFSRNETCQTTLCGLIRNDWNIDK